MNPSQAPPFHELQPLPFQELCLDVTKMQPEVQKATIYGSNGQAQRGTDIHAELRDGGIWLIQCKAHRTFTKMALRAAVDDFWKHYEWWKESRVRRFTIAVGSGIETTQVLATAKELEDKFRQKGVTFELWDSRQLRDHLKPHRFIVERHCRDWADHICGQKSPPRAQLDTPGEVAVVPKELRSYDEHDAAFFLRLVPGLKDSGGIPPSVRFWASRLNDPNDTSFSVGLIWGPSGCGKSSIVRAGLFPILDKHVLPIRIEAAPQTTETRIRNALLKMCPIHNSRATLRSIIEGLAAGEQLPKGITRVVLVIDQFEEWLQGFRADKESELMQALHTIPKDCKSFRILVLVRLDLLPQASRFFGALDVKLDSETNVVLVDAFEPPHAELVLRLFHEAYFGKDLQLDSRFVAKAIEEMKGDHGRIVPVQLCVFATFMSSRSWDVSTLDTVGGVKGVGRRFLQDKIQQRANNPKLALQPEIAKCILKSLLPDHRSLILRPRLSFRRMLDKCGPSITEEQLEELCRILDSELHLVTPAEHDANDDGAQEAGHNEGPDSRWYRLSHDYLVAPLQDWLLADERKTLRGRWRLRLKGFGARWHRWPEPSTLPRLYTWIGLQLFTNCRDRDLDEAAVMHRATRLHLNRLAISALVILVGIILGGLFLMDWRVRGIIASLESADTKYVPNILDGNWIPHWYMRPKISLRISDLGTSEHSRNRLYLALLRREASAVIRSLGLALVDAPLAESVLIRDQLQRHGGDLDSVCDFLRTAMEDKDRPSEVRLKAVSALAAFDAKLANVPQDLGEQLIATVAKNPQSIGAWISAFDPQKAPFVRPGIEKVFRHPRSDSLSLSIATDLLKSFHRDDPKALAELIYDARPSSLEPLVESLRKINGKHFVLFPKTLQSNTLPTSNPADTEAATRRAANGALARWKLGDKDALLEKLELDADPRVRTIILQHMLSSGRTADLMSTSIAATSNGALMGLIAETASDASGAPGDDMRNYLINLFRQTADAGVHSYCEWALRRWNALPALEAAGLSQDRNWYVSPSGQTMAVLKGGNFRMGAAPNFVVQGEEDRERQHWVTIDRTFALATHEVTLGEFSQFRDEHKSSKEGQRLRHGATDQHPVNNVNWYDAVHYCNYLNRREGIPEDQWPFPNDWCLMATTNCALPHGYLARTGYRLPTEAEWEFACRSGTVTSRYFDDTGEHMSLFTRNIVNSEGESMAVVGAYLPNAYGMFDMLGNAMEWCLEPFRDFSQSGEKWLDHEVVQPVGARKHICRGGSFYNPLSRVKSSYRYQYQPEARTENMGFRVARTISPLTVVPPVPLQHDGR